MRLERPEPMASSPNNVTDVRKTTTVYAKAWRRASDVDVDSGPAQNQA